METIATVSEKGAEYAHLYFPGIENGADLQVMVLLGIALVIGFIVAKVKGATFF